MEANTPSTSSPNYTPSPQEVVTKAYVEVVEAAARYEEERIRYGGQVTQETSRDLVVCYNQLGMLLSSEVRFPVLGEDVDRNLVVVRDVLGEVKGRGYFNTQMVMGE